MSGRNCISKYLNHSPNPNLFPTCLMVNNEPRVLFFAIEDIASGTELTIQYNHITNQTNHSHATRRHRLLTWLDSEIYTGRPKLSSTRKMSIGNTNKKAEMTVEVATSSAQPTLSSSNQQSDSRLHVVDNSTVLSKANADLNDFSSCLTSESPSLFSSPTVYPSASASSLSALSSSSASTSTSSDTCTYAYTSTSTSSSSLSLEQIIQHDSLLTKLKDYILSNCGNLNQWICQLDHRKKNDRHALTNLFLFTTIIQHPMIKKLQITETLVTAMKNLYKKIDWTQHNHENGGNITKQFCLNQDTNIQWQLLTTDETFEMLDSNLNNAFDNMNNHNKMIPLDRLTNLLACLAATIHQSYHDLSCNRVGNGYDILLKHFRSTLKLLKSKIEKLHPQSPVNSITDVGYLLTHLHMYLYQYYTNMTIDTTNSLILLFIIDIKALLFQYIDIAIRSKRLKSRPDLAIELGTMLLIEHSHHPKLHEMIIEIIDTEKRVWKDSRWNYSEEEIHYFYVTLVYLVFQLQRSAIPSSTLLPIPLAMSRPVQLSTTCQNILYVVVDNQDDNAITVSYQYVMKPTSIDNIHCVYDSLMKEEIYKAAFMNYVKWKNQWNCKRIKTKSTRMKPNLHDASLSISNSTVPELLLLAHYNKSLLEEYSSSVHVNIISDVEWRTMTSMEREKQLKQYDRIYFQSFLNLSADLHETIQCFVSQTIYAKKIVNNLVVQQWLDCKKHYIASLPQEIRLWTRVVSLCDATSNVLFDDHNIIHELVPHIIACFEDNLSATKLILKRPHSSSSCNIMKLWKRDCQDANTKLITKKEVGSALQTIFKHWPIHAVPSDCHRDANGDSSYGNDASYRSFRSRSTCHVLIIQPCDDCLAKSEQRSILFLNSYGEMEILETIDTELHHPIGEHTQSGEMDIETYTRIVNDLLHSQRLNHSTIDELQIIKRRMDLSREFILHNPYIRTLSTWILKHYSSIIRCDTFVNIKGQVMVNDLAYGYHTNYFIQSLHPNIARRVLELHSDTFQRMLKVD